MAEQPTKPPISIIASGDFENGLSIDCKYLPEQSKHMPNVLRSVAKFLELYANRIEEGGKFGGIPSLEHQLELQLEYALANDDFEQAAKLHDLIQRQKRG